MHLLADCLALASIFQLVSSEEKKMEGFIVWGDKANIESFPHAAFMSLSCEINHSMSRWRCGASILNQEIFLTAAHCLDTCQHKGHITLSIGHEHRLQGQIVKVKEFRTHQLYKRRKLVYDIALLKGRSPLTFNSKISRVAIMRNPPYFETAQLSGWGYVNEIKETQTDLLHYTQQQVMDRKYCKKIFKNLRAGTFCARGNKGYASLGDSGSALIVRGYIQIGLVSYKKSHRSRSDIVYTDIGYYYDWIVTNAKELLCQ